jgi:hypothetical protein
MSSEFGREFSLDTGSEMLVILLQFVFVVHIEVWVGQGGLRVPSLGDNKGISQRERYPYREVIRQSVCHLTVYCPHFMQMHVGGEWCMEYMVDDRVLLCLGW